MNRAFRIIWSHTRQAFMVADEHASAGGKRASGRLLLTAALVGLSQQGVALAATEVCTRPDNFITGSSAGHDTCTLNNSNGSVRVTGEIYNQNGPAITAPSGFYQITSDAGIITSSQTAIELNGAMRGNWLENGAGSQIQGGNYGIELKNGYTLTALSNAGEITANHSDGAALLIDGATLRGLVNAPSGTLLNTAGGNAIRLQNNARIGNQLYNMGTIGSASTLSAALYGDNSLIEGSLTNEGTLRNSESATQAALVLSRFSIGETLYNSGVIEGGQGAIHLNESTIGGDIINTGSLLGLGNGHLAALSLTGRSQTRDILNQGVIRSNSNGIEVSDGSTVRKITNSGTIQSAYGLVVDRSQVEEIDNQQGGVIKGEEAALQIIDNSTVTHLNNSGRIEGSDQQPSAGIHIQDGARLTAFTNSGIVKGSVLALFDTGVATHFDHLYIKGDNTAAFQGDVLAQSAELVVKSKATFSSSNAFSVKSFTVEQGATLNMGAGTSTSAQVLPGLMADGITVSQGFHNAGTVALAAGTSAALHGDYQQATSGTLQIGVANDTRYGKLAVDGTATLPSNAKIDVNVATPNHSFSTQRLQNVLSAGKLVSDGTFAVTDNSTLFNFGAVKEGNNVSLTLAAAVPEKPGKPETPTPEQPQPPKPEQPQPQPPKPEKPEPVAPGLVEEIVTDLGNAPAVGAAQVLDQVIRSSPSSELASHFVGLTSEQQVSDAVTSTLPTAASNTSSATSSTLAGINRVIQARQAGNSGLSSGDAPQTEDNLWLKTFGSQAEQDQRSGISGYDADTQGLAIGADAALSETTRLGMAFAYARTNLDNDSRVAPQSAKIDTFLLIGYGSYALAEDTELNFQLDVGQNRSEGKRHMPFANLTATSDYDSYSAHAGIGIGHSLRLSEQLTFVPSARVDYTWIESEDYQEKGADTLNLNVEGSDSEELLFSVDGKLDYAFSEATVLSANLGAGYDVINEQSSITSLYAGAPGAAFKTPGMEMEPWLARAGLGLTHTLDNGTEVSLRYDAEARSGFTNQGASLKARWAF
ncbi:autotransporter domain-containing protein [Pseudomonas sp. BBP2017]|uniref:autotransporter domain-containing protein n=1 Tax=Pseudomonas sp. BBP2017 TaxID=2109731 RepID=UPI000D1236E8|nr:autotransporter domain-containing protein [Pseudomonas sp. BBP2017]PSS57033.1 hypothetical protein C6382_11105 [Pseudomonas sp. BBP2017]